MRKFLGALALTLPALFSHQASAEELNVLYSNAYLLKTPMDEIIKGFEALHPEAQVKLTDVKGYADMTQLMLRAAVTGGIPDVAFQGTSFLKLFADREMAIPLDDFIKAEPNWNSMGYSNSITEVGMANGEIYGIPFAVSIPTVYFNGNLLKAAGGDPSNPPKTWQGIIDIAKKIKAQSGSIYFDYSPTGNWTFISLIQAAGGSMMTPDMKKIAFNGSEGLEALKILQGIGEAGMMDMSRDQAKQAFSAGAIGIFVTSSSDITSYTEQAKGHFQVVVSQFPLPSPQGTLPAGGSAIMIHTKDPTKQKLAWEFLKYATNPQSQTTMVRAASYIPINSIAVEKTGLLREFYEENPNLSVPVSQLDHLTGFFSFPGENSTKITKIIQDQLQAVITLKRSPEEALHEMTTQVEALLPKN